MTQAQASPAHAHLQCVAARVWREEQSDGCLLQLFLKEKHQEAFAELIRRHGPLVYAVCRRVLRRNKDSQEAFQATFLLLARRAPTLITRGSLGGWLHEVAGRMALNMRRAAAMSSKQERKEAALWQAAVPRPDAYDLLQELFDKAVWRLPVKQREPYVLCCLEGLTGAEAAQRLALPERTVRGRLARARQRLQRELGGDRVTAGLAAGIAGVAPHCARGGMRAGLVNPTARAAVLLAQGQPVPAGVISARVLLLLYATKCFLIPRAD